MLIWLMRLNSLISYREHGDKLPSALQTGALISEHLPL